MLYLTSADNSGIYKIITSQNENKIYGYLHVLTASPTCHGVPLGSWEHQSPAGYSGFTGNWFPLNLVVLKVDVTVFWV